MAYWLAKTRNGQERDYIQRFDPRFWTVNFPRPMMAAVTTAAHDALRVDCVFYRQQDLAGLIWDSEDTLDHPLAAYTTSRDYRHSTLSFRWRSEGIMPLDVPNGPTLTIEGRDRSGNARTWFVRLWNYAQGLPEDAVVTLPFSELRAGFILPDEADAVFAGDIDRMFISLVSAAYDPEGGDLPVPAEGWAQMDSIRVDGAGAVMEVGDVILPPHGIGMCTAFDDSGTQTPARLLRNIRALGYRGEIVHYLGMSHYFTLQREGAGVFLVDDRAPAFNVAAQAWHRSFFEECVRLGFEPIASLSYELLAQHCPPAWQQRDASGNPAQTGWDPPSSLLSPANTAAMAYLQKVGREVVAMLQAAGAPVRFQIGEPWWWVFGDGRICIYDEAARAEFGGDPLVIETLAAPLDAARKALLDKAGAMLARSTAELTAAVRTAAGSGGADVRLLAFLPTVLDPVMPEALRANLPVGWASPAFDRLQIEDYDWLTAGRQNLRRVAYALVDERLGYPIEEQDYLAGFVLRQEDASVQWQFIDAGLDEARERGVPRCFVWASPQVVRDGYVRLPSMRREDDMQAFDDIAYPLGLGRGSAVMPEFSTNVVVTASGHEHRNALWSDARLRFDVGPGVRSEAELGILIEFFRARRGAARAFRLRDSYDCSSRQMTGEPTAFDQLIGTGDGSRSAFALLKRYGSGGDPQERRITRPDPETILISVDGVATRDWVLGPLGTINFDTAPAFGAAVRAGFLFDVPVRFAEDRIDINGAVFAAGEAPSIPLLEVREMS
ncbi:DUF2460 domain-containing protein [Croceicoccus sp. F390]|uniref:DUF2460 domain-containing protein n=1 Tax=Croceicoccus esteveae TaxID=3075597 RepID=A0ABU2ZIW4_9SPHN|nr:DUF2460 domain-containing protein [Croceicoccus sp. F390]MDT0576534.1 DUF2460 domain-containing protein [Croceicoccus sp. F390]